MQNMRYRYKIWKVEAEYEKYAKYEVEIPNMESRFRI
jgi:hypothetical protein